ncbi:dTDP-4-amino-4,6-dideoxyglucose formyltransferase [Pseudoalteromonas sp. T1lg22]|uniref:dTDP-4-amino-4,6-dideoxyglucose formyltransferase n=1 Tax=Pseudoalteromonas sp. T1lg22 TaxID=2077096 RepID=UPI000CF65F6B|nr:dTDP-4-amino-4,6-dideoxyglucose formyltransferase [Pseudoalteromonas sp. T1lg22]
MKNVLVISDNYELVSCIQETVSRLSIDAHFEYKYSAINKKPAQLDSLRMSSVNVKDEKVINKIISSFDLVISAHCKQIFPKKLVESVRCVNIHPGLNPHNRGWYPQVFSIINKQPVGCTIHEIDEDIDHGKVIYQKEVDIYQSDDSQSVYNRVQQAEKELIGKYLNQLVEGDYSSSPMSDEGNYNSIDDFKMLCELDLNREGTLGEHIDLLRALTHGEYKNAFFKSKAGEKIYVSICLENGFF